MEPFECPHCERYFDSDYEMQDIWYEPCNDGSYNSYVSLYCPYCEEYVSVAV